MSIKLIIKNYKTIALITMVLLSACNRNPNNNNYQFESLNNSVPLEETNKKTNTAKTIIKEDPITQETESSITNGIKKDTPKPVDLNRVFYLAEQKNKLDFYIKDDMQKTVDGLGYKISYKKKDDEGILIYKKSTLDAYWVHGDIFQSYFELGGVNLFGYPTSNQEELFPDKLKSDISKQTFEESVMYLFHDKERESFYKSVLIKRYKDTKKVDDINYSFKDYPFPTFSKKPTGREGDPVNVIIVAKNKDQINKVFLDGNWVEPEFGWRNLPFSELELFGRKQDIGFARETSSLITLYKRRHHIRLWKTDLKEKDFEVWIGGATEDIAVKLKDKALKQEEKQNNAPDKSNPLTHAIDPDTDKEREYVKNTLDDKNPKIQSYYIRSNQIKDSDGIVETLNGGLDLVIWDGKILILDLTNIE